MPQVNAIDANDIDTQVLLAKALRKAFNQTQSDLLDDDWMSDESLVEQVREMQEQYKTFKRLTSAIKLADEAVYDREILGIKRG